MKTFEFKLPDIGEGVTEGEIIKWLVTPGTVVTEDQPLVEVMTDKATVTITSPRAGKILETRGEAGSQVPVHSVLVVYDVSEPASAPAAADAPKGEPAATAVGDIKETLPGMSLMTTQAAAPVHAPTPSQGGPQVGPPTGVTSLGPTRVKPTRYFNDKPLATPATRALARELGVDLRVVPPTGPHGRVTKEDVRTVGFGVAATIAPQAPSSIPMTPAPTAERTPVPRGEITQEAAKVRPVTELPLPPPATRPAAKISLPITVSEDRVPLRGVRKRIFEGMARSKHTAAHFTFVEECDVTALKELRAKLRPAAEKEGVKLTFLPFIIKAVVAALKKHPMLNSAFDEETQEIVVRRYYDIGVASATEAGLIVPVVRSADRRSILDIGREVARLGELTKNGKVSSNDLGGSTFTITSLGAQGGLFATPILNFPEVAILGVHQMKQKPVVRQGQIVIGDVMLLSLSFDHRLIDGHVGAAFAYEIIGYLQEPDRLFLEMA